MKDKHSFAEYEIPFRGDIREVADERRTEITERRGSARNVH